MSRHSSYMHARRAILRALREAGTDGLTGTELMRRANVPPSSYYHARRMLEADGAIWLDGGQRGYWRMPAKVRAASSEENNEVPYVFNAVGLAEATRRERESSKNELPAHLTEALSRITEQGRSDHVIRVVREALNMLDTFMGIEVGYPANTTGRPRWLKNLRAGLLELGRLHNIVYKKESA